MFRSLRLGVGTGSPYIDCIVTLKVKIQIGDKLMFAHEDFDEIDLPENQISSTKCAQYDLEKYELPAAIRKILKKQKRN